MLNTDFCLWISTKPRTLSAPWVFWRSRWRRARVLGLDLTWPRLGVAPGLGLRKKTDSNFYSDDRLLQQPLSSVTQVWLLLSTDYCPSGCSYMFYAGFCASLLARLFPKNYHLALQSLRGTQHFQHSVLAKPSFWIITEYLSETRWEKRFSSVKFQELTAAPGEEISRFSQRLR